MGSKGQGRTAQKPDNLTRGSMDVTCFRPQQKHPFLTTETRWRSLNEVLATPLTEASQDPLEKAWSETFS